MNNIHNTVSINRAMLPPRQLPQLRAERLLPVKNISRTDKSSCRQHTPNSVAKYAVPQIVEYEVSVNDLCSQMPWYGYSCKHDVLEPANGMPQRSLRRYWMDKLDLNRRKMKLHTLVHTHLHTSCTDLTLCHNDMHPSSRSEPQPAPWPIFKSIAAPFFAEEESILFQTQHLLPHHLHRLDPAHAIVTDDLHIAQA